MAADTLNRVLSICAGRHNALSGSQPRQAWAYLAIISQANELHWSSEHEGRDLLNWLSQPHGDADLLNACNVVIEQLGSYKPAKFE